MITRLFIRCAFAGLWLGAVISNARAAVKGKRR